MAKLAVREGTHGRGVFAEEPIRKGDLVLRYGGPSLRYKDTTPQTYAIQVGPDLYLGASGGPDDYVNHCCEPNCGLLINSPSDVTLIAIRDIEAGEEIFFDYSTTMDEDDFEMLCHCGAPACRRLVRDGKHLPDDVWTRYERLGILPGYVRRSRRQTVEIAPNVKN
jgi:uncharacterized protein